MGTPHSPRANDGEPRTEEAVRGSRRSIVMTPFLYVLVGLCLSAVVVARVLLARRQEKDRCTFRVVFPREVRAEQVVALLTALSGSVGDTFVIEVSATSEGIVHRLVAPVRSSEFLAYQMRAAIPGVRLLPDESSPTCGSGCELRLTSHTVPLRSDEPAATSTAILASLSAASDAGVVVQWVITPKRHLPLLRVSRNHDPLESLLTDRINGRRTIGAADELRRRMEKAKTPLFHAALRVGIDDQSRMSRAHDVLATLGSARSSGVRFGRRFVPVLLVGERIRERRIPALVWPVLINASNWHRSPGGRSTARSSQVSRSGLHQASTGAPQSRARLRRGELPRHGAASRHPFRRRPETCVCAGAHRDREVHARTQPDPSTDGTGIRALRLRPERRSDRRPSRTGSPCPERTTSSSSTRWTSGRLGSTSSTAQRVSRT